VGSEERAASAAPSTGEWLPYRTGQEHFADLLERHDWRLKREIALGHARKPADILGFAAITDQEVQRLLDSSIADVASGSPVLQTIERQLQDTERRIAGRVAQTQALRLRLPLLALAKRFALSARDLDILFACLAVEIDRRYERIYGYLHDDMSRRQPSPGLVLNLYGGNAAEQLIARGLLNPLAPLRYYRLVELMEDSPTMPWLSRPLRIDERIVAFLLGDTTIDARIARYVSRAQGAEEAGSLSKSQHETSERLAQQLRHWMKAAPTPKKPLVYLHGARSAGAEALARAAASALGIPLLPCDVELLAVEPAGNIEQTIFLMFREAVLSRAALLLRNLDRLLENPANFTVYAALLRCLTEMGRVTFVSGASPWAWPIPTDPIVLHVMELQSASLTEQFDAWHALAGETFSPAELHRLVSLHSLPLEGIREAWQMAQGLAAAESTSATARIEHLHQACRVQGGTPASSLARRVEPKHTWDDLILPAPQREQLVALCSQARHGSIVYGTWCFDRKLSLGRSLNALFCGPPGTGKTLAAEVIAADLGLALLKIDLSHVVSKYIGETEKNLRQLFDQAASANAILFFDEADALLGKRSEVKDAHDRYANTETAYLLQKIEEYAGITILSTNLGQNLDDAFTRRMRFIVSFPLPEEADRLRIWQTVWPRELPLAADVDLTAVARKFRLSGGSIRNVALSAAFIAAERVEPVSMRHLMQAIRRELRNMGRIVNEEDMRAVFGVEARRA
jgi:ATPase family associated with various cellular activities (AAA)